MVRATAVRPVPVVEGQCEPHLRIEPIADAAERDGPPVGADGIVQGGRTGPDPQGDEHLDTGLAVQVEDLPGDLDRGFTDNTSLPVDDRTARDVGELPEGEVEPGTSESHSVATAAANSAHSRVQSRVIPALQDEPQRPGHVRAAVREQQTVQAQRLGQIVASGAPARRRSPTRTSSTVLPPGATASHSPSPDGRPGSPTGCPGSTCASTQSTASTWPRFGKLDNGEILVCPYTNPRGRPCSRGEGSDHGRTTRPNDADGPIGGDVARVASVMGVSGCPWSSDGVAPLAARVTTPAAPAT